MIQLWAVPITVRYPDLAYDEEDWSDVYLVLSRDDDSTPQTWGEFDVGNASRLADPVFFEAWLKLITAQHEKWREEAAS